VLELDVKLPFNPMTGTLRRRQSADLRFGILFNVSQPLLISIEVAISGTTAKYIILFSVSSWESSS
jgi:hypothetical protein